MAASKKRALGQFFTTNYDHILQGMRIPDGITKIIEPFAGNGDLLNFISDRSKYQIECFDIDPKHDYITKMDTILNPPDYKGKFMITNPPYLAKNKTKDRDPFEKYPVDDLYKCVMFEIANDESNYPIGGIIIIPLNFWCSIRSADIELRRAFLARYIVDRVNIFEEQVFDDTTYTVCSMQFHLRRTDEPKIQNIAFHIYPVGKIINIALAQNNNYTIGGEIYLLPPSSKYEITRLTSKNKGKEGATNIYVKCIDDGTEGGENLGVSLVEDSQIYIDETPKLTSRTYATLLIKPAIPLEKQKVLAKKINAMLSGHRDKYHSLFLTNYRESKESARKRISFELVYLIAGYILDKIDEKHALTTN
jgi:hypothetical protein